MMAKKVRVWVAGALVVGAATAIAVLLLEGSRRPEVSPIPATQEREAREAASRAAGAGVPDARETTGVDRPAPAEAALPERARIRPETSVRGVFSAPRGVWPGGGVAELHPAPEPRTGLFDVMGQAMQPGDAKPPDHLESWFGITDPVASAEVRGEGSFLLADPPPGRFRLHLRHPHLTVAVSTELEVERGDEIDLGTVGTQPAASLLVLVSDEEGQPVERARLVLGPEFDPSRFSDASALADMPGLMRQLVPVSGRTDARGAHRFGGLTEPRWKLRVHAEGLVEDLRDVAVAPGTERIVRVELAAGASLRVLVVGRDGEPFEGARVRVRGADGGPRFAFGQVVQSRWAGQGLQRETAADGTCSFDGLPPGAAAVSLRTPGFLPAEQRVGLEEGATADVTLALDRGETITGAVVDEAGTPIAEARVADVPMLGQKVMGFDVGGFVGEPVLAAAAREDGVATDAEGRFVLGGFEPGDEAHLIATADGYLPARRDDVPSGSTDVTIALARETTLAGTVVSGPEETPVAEFEVRMRERAWLMIERTVRSEHFRGAADGRFVLEHAPRGSFSVDIVGAAGGRWSGDADLREGAVDLGTVRLEPPGAVAGRVVDPAGAPIGGAAVRIAKGGLLDSVALSAFVGTEMVRSAADGGFRLEGLQPGRVRLLADADGFAPYRSDPIVIDSGETATGVVLRLDRGGGVRGRVVDETGAPLAGWNVQVQTADARALRTTTTGSEGRFRVTGLAPGSHEVQAQPSDYVERFSGGDFSFDPEGGRFDISGMMDAAMRWSVRERVVVRAGEDAEVELVFERPEEGARRALVTVAGRVTVGGEPLADGAVAFAAAGSVAPTRFASVEGGEFSLSRVAPGAWRVEVQRGVMTAAIGRARTLQVPAVERHELTIDLPGGGIAGTVRRAGDGTPVAGAIVSLSGGERTVVGVDRPELEGATFAGGNGEFRFEGLDAGTYDIVARELVGGAGGAEVGRVSGLVLGAGSRIEDVVVRLQPGGAVRAAVRDRSGPRLNALVTPLHADGTPLDLLHRTLTDENGIGLVAGLPEGGYRVLVEAPKATPYASGVLQVEPGITIDVDARLQTGVPVLLRLQEDLHARLRGQPVGFAIWRTDGTLQRQGRKIVPPPPAPMELGHLQPGTYRLQVAGSAGTWEVEREVERGRAEWTLP